MLKVDRCTPTFLCPDVPSGCSLSRHGKDTTSSDMIDFCQSDVQTVLSYLPFVLPNMYAQQKRLGYVDETAMMLFDNNVW
jgi:hypothetical protein